MSAEAFLPDLLVSGGEVLSGVALVVDAGQIVSVGAPPPGVPTVRLAGQALLPGMVNAHSHAFQRTLRGRTHGRASTNAREDFWSWRHRMYQVASRLTPETLYVASRMAFLEMALGGITAVGEFHYLHHAPDGARYGDPNEMATQVIRAARDVGLRIALLRTVYARAGFRAEADPRQKRFFDGTPDESLNAAASLQDSFRGRPGVSVGLAPHSVRAVPPDWLPPLAAESSRRRWAVHMHVAEQPAEIEACVAETGQRPIGVAKPLLSERFTAVHAIHVTDDEVAQIAAAGASVCACPTTERDLGDGVFPGEKFLGRNVSVSLGSDSHAVIDLFEDAREVELNLRLSRQSRNVLPTAGGGSNPASAIARLLWRCATQAGARSLGLDAGDLRAGSVADFLTVDLSDPALAGGDSDLVSSVVFGACRSSVRSVWVGGERVVLDGRHARQPEIVESFQRLQKELWS